MEGKLFSQDFLLDGIRSTPVWEALPDAALDDFNNKLARIYASLTADSKLNEANTEADIIEKVLDLLGWHDLTLKQVTASSTGREDVPDFLLFPDEVAKQAARAEKRDDRRYRHGVAVLEAKRWMRPLDRGDATNRLDPGTPSNQILRYLSSVEVASDRKVRWGVLTNGAVWRLYWQGARSRSEEFLELDLAALLGVPGAEQDLFGLEQSHGIKLFSACSSAKLSCARLGTKKLAPFTNTLSTKRACMRKKFRRTWVHAYSPPSSRSSPMPLRRVILMLTLALPLIWPNCVKPR